MKYIIISTHFIKHNALHQEFDVTSRVSENPYRGSIQQPTKRGQTKSKTEEKTGAGEKVPTAKIIQLKKCLDRAPTPRDQ